MQANKQIVIYAPCCVSSQTISTYLKEAGKNSVFQAASSLLKDGGSGYPLWRPYMKGRDLTLIQHHLEAH